MEAAPLLYLLERPTQLALLPARQSFTNFVRSAPASFLPSACLLQAFREACFAGAALGAGVAEPAAAVVAVEAAGAFAAAVPAGASAAKAEPHPIRAMAARVAAIFMSGLRLRV